MSLLLFEAVSILGSFLIRIVFPFVIHSTISTFQDIYSFPYPVCLGWKWVFKPESMYAINAWSFPVGYLLSVALNESKCFFNLRAFFCNLQQISHVVYPFGFYVMLSPFQYFALFFFCFNRIRLLQCHCSFSFYFLLEFSINALECPFLFVLVLSQYRFSFPSFASILRFLSSGCIFCSNCVTFLYSSKHILKSVFGLSSFACYHRFF